VAQTTRRDPTPQMDKEDDVTQTSETVAANVPPETPPGEPPYVPGGPLPEPYKTVPIEPPPAYNSPDDIAMLTADEARVRLTRDGANMTMDVKRLLTERAASASPPRPRAPAMATPFGGTMNSPITLEEAARGEPVVTCLFTRAVMLTIEGNARIAFGVGRQEVPVRFVEPKMHSYLEACGVKRA